MPRLRRKSRERRGWTEQDRRYLQQGWCVGECVGEGFGHDDNYDEQSCREAWNDLGDELLAEHIAQAPGTRPWAWWLFDAPEPRRRMMSNEQAGWAPIGPPNYYGKPGSFKPLGGVTCHLSSSELDRMFETEADYLTRLGLLTNEEKSLTKFQPRPE